MPIIGRVTKQNDGSYRGELKTLTIIAPLEIRKNREKTYPGEADYFVFSSTLQIGTGTILRDKTRRQYVALHIAAPEFGPRRLAAVLAPAIVEGVKSVFSLHWEPEEYSAQQP